MNEVKKPKKPLIFYYLIVLGVILLINLFVTPFISQLSVEEVGYDTFIKMAEDQNISQVEIQSNQIIFTDKSEENIYKTGIIDDPNLIERLNASGAVFGSEIIEETSPFISFILSWIVPIAIFSILGHFLSKKLMNKSGGANSMMFNIGKSNAKIYVKSSDGIKFDDVAGEDEAKENLAEIVDYLYNPKKYSEIGASMPKGIGWTSRNR